MRDPYLVLGVKRTAGPEEIKAAWRTLAKSLHPDRNRNDPDAGSRFAEVGQAYQLLKDPERRFRYDMERRQAEERKRKATGTTARKPGSAGPEASPGNKKAKVEATSSNAGEKVSGFFRKFTQPPPKPEKAPDLYLDVWASIEDLFSRANPQVELPDGRSVRVPLPDAACEGTKVRVAGQGYKISGLQRGDLIATLRIKPHKLFRPDGCDLYVDLAVDIENAVLGCDTIVDAPEGPIRIKVPEWTGSNRSLIVKGRGLPKEGGERGDLYAQVRVMLWDHPDDKVKDLMRSLREGLFL